MPESGRNLQFVLRFISLLAIVAALGCGPEQHEITSFGGDFGLQRYGGGMPHAASYISLLLKDRNGKWTTIWHAISFRCQGASGVSDRKIVFGGVSSLGQPDNTVRLLFFSEQTGVVDITDAVAERAGIGGKVSAQIITLERKESVLGIMVEGDNSFKVQISFDDLTAIAGAIVARNVKRTFDGIEIHE